MAGRDLLAGVSADELRAAAARIRGEPVGRDLLADVSPDELRSAASRVRQEAPALSAKDYARAVDFGESDRPAPASAKSFARAVDFGGPPPPPPKTAKEYALAADFGEGTPHAPPPPEDSAGTVARKFVENLPARAEQWIGGLLQATPQIAAQGVTTTMPFGSSIAPYIAAAFDTALKPVTDAGEALGKDARETLAANAPNVEEGSAKWYGYQIANAMTDLAAATGASIATRTPAAGMALLGGQVFGQQFDQSRAQGRTGREAFQDASFMAVAEMVGEEIPLGLLMKPGGKVLGRVFKSAAAEGVQEMVTQVLQTGYEKGVLNPNMTWGEAVNSVVQAGIIGSVAGGGTAIVTAPFTRAAPGEGDNTTLPTEETIRSSEGVVTPDDVASPLDTSLIAKGKEMISGLLGKNPFTEARSVEPLPEIPGPTPAGGFALDPVTKTDVTPQPKRGNERAAFIKRVGGVESGNRDNAENPNSSASGRYQFTDGTWAALGGDPAKKNDPAEQERLMKKLTDQNEAALRKAGIEPTAGDYYLAHFAGAGGAIKLHQNPDAPVEDILGAKVVAANPFLKGMKGRDVIAWAARKMGGEAVAGEAAPAEPDTLDLTLPERKPSESAEDMLKRVLGDDVLEPKKGERVDVTQGGETVPGTVEAVYETNGKRGVRIAKDDGTAFDETLDDAKEYGARITRPVPETGAAGNQVDSPVAIRPSENGRRVEVSGLTEAQKDAIKAAAPDITAEGAPGGALSFPKKYEATIRSVVEPATDVAAEPVAPADTAPGDIPDVKPADTTDTTTKTEGAPRNPAESGTNVAEADARQASTQSDALIQPIRRDPGGKIPKASDYEDQGRAAGAAGYTAADNPYLETSTAHTRWAKGVGESSPGMPLADAIAETDPGLDYDSTERIDRLPMLQRAGLNAATARRVSGASWAELEPGIRGKIEAELRAGYGTLATEESSKTVAAQPEDSSAPFPVRQLGRDDNRYAVTTGAVLTTASGRKMAPAPKWDDSTPMKLRMSLNRQRDWLVDEARKEARAGNRNETWMLDRIANEGGKNIAPVDWDLINDTLFGNEAGPQPPKRSAATPADVIQAAKDSGRVEIIDTRRPQGSPDAPRANQPEAAGARAFADGEARVAPGEFDVGTSVGRAKAEAWYRGWDRANLAAPLPQDAPAEGVDVRHPDTGEAFPDALARSRAMLAQYPEGGTSSIANDAVQADGRTRGQMRSDIVDSILAKPAAQGREAHIIIGTPASGKSSMADPLAEQRNARIVDSDDAKKELPEFEGGVGAMAVHQESSDIAVRAQELSIERGDNIILPLVGKDYDGLRSKIEALGNSGYKVYLHLVELSTEETTRRGIGRFGSQGRLVDPAYIRSVGQKPIETFNRLVRDDAGLLEGYTHVSNEVPKGQPPKLIAERNPPVRLGRDRAEGVGARAEDQGNEPRGVAERDVRPEPDRPVRPEGYGSKNKLVTTERANELRARLKAKLATQLNAGLDPELIAIGTELAVYHIEAGARKFADFARAVAADLDTNPGKLKAYLRGWYNGARDFIEDSGEDVEGMDGPGAVRAALAMIEDSETPAPSGIVETEATENGDATDTGTSARDDRNGDAGTRAGDARGPEEERATGQGAERSGGSRGADLRADDVAGADGNQPGERGAVVGGDDRGNDAGAQPGERGGNRASNRVRAKSAGSGTDYAAPRGSLTRKGSWKETASRNLDIVELVNRLDAENRPATPEEQALLAAWTGWGAGEIRNNLLGNNVRRNAAGEREIGVNSYSQWADLQKRAAELLKGPALETALQSTQYAHYTSEDVIRSIWAGVERLGFAGGRILEPGMGNGLFAVAAPQGIMGDSHYTGLELDEFTAKVAKYLLPQETAIQADYTKHKLPDGFFDLAIGNPPFADIKVLSDPAYRKNRFSLHDYFFAKSIDKVRPGGLMVFVTSRYTMDKLNQKSRQYIADRADLLAAVRLPQTAFKENAGTEVVTDVLFFQRRAPGQEPGGQAWLKTENVTTKTSDGRTVKHMVNEYYKANPKMVLGKHSSTGSMYRQDDYTVEPLAQPIEKLFAKAMEALPADVYVEAPKEAKSQAQARTFERDFAPASSKEGGLYVKGDDLMVVENGAGINVNAYEKPPTAAEQVWLKSYVGVRDALKQAQKDQLQDGDWEKSHAALLKAYRAHVAAHGRFKEFTTYERTTTDDDGEKVTTAYRRYKWAKLLGLDVEGVLVEALEKVTDEGEIKDGPFLGGRTLNKPTRPVIETAEDALAVTLDEIGHVDLAYAASLWGKSRDDLLDALGDSVFEAPDGTWQTADEYLSGYVVDKLEEAKAAAATDPRFERNVDALIAVQPRPLAHSDITVKLGAGWVPPEVVKQFADEVLGFDRVPISYNVSKAEWTVEGSGARYARSNTSDYGTDRRSPLELLDAVLNNRTIKVTEKDSDGKTYTNPVATEAAQQAAKKLEDKFKSWVWTDAERAQRLSDLYNRQFNNIAPRTFNGDHMTFPGLSSRFKLYPHQKRAVWRVVQTGNSHLAHGVGAGKTLEMIVSGMEMRRLGLIKKPMYVVPNHMLNQFSYEFLEAYPAANIMVADEKSFHTDNRKRFMAQAALNDPDAIIVTHSSFKKIDTGEESRSLVVQDMIVELEEALEGADTRQTRSKIEKQIERLKEKFAAATGDGRDKAVLFEETGVDFLFVDEAHEYRKLDFATNRSAKGIDANGSQKSMDLFIKVNWLNQQNPGRAVVFASGTPVTNTMAELFTVMRFLDLKGLQEDGLAHFDAWANMFGEMASALEKNAVGNYEMVERFAKFVNVADLMKRVRKFMDVLTNDQLGDLVKRPKIKNGKPFDVVSPPVEALQDYMAGPLNDRLTKSKNWKPSRDEPNNPDPIIAINGDALLSSIDMRFINPDLPSDPKSKLNVMIDRIIEKGKEFGDLEYTGPDGKKEPRKGATQIVFSPVGFGDQVAQNRGFSAKEWINKRLIEAGFKASEIGWMSYANSHAKKEQLQKDVRSGKVKVLLGTPKNMGTGLNVQTRLKVLHYLSPPWYPSDVEQPHGRIERQGNLNEEVEIYWYATKETYEASAWGMVARKARFIQQALSGDDSVRVIDDISAVSQYELAAALAAGDDRAIKVAGLGQDIERLQRLRDAHAQQQRDLKRTQRFLESNIPEREARAEQYREAAKAKGTGYQPFGITIDGKTLDKQGEAGKALLDAIDKAILGSESGIPTKEIGKLHDKHPIVMRKARLNGEAFTVSVNIGPVEYEVAGPMGSTADLDPVGLSRKIENTTSRVIGDLRAAEEAIAEAKAEKVKVEKRIGAPFEEEAALAEKIAERATIEAELAAEGAAKEAERKAVPTAQAQAAANLAARDLEEGDAQGQAARTAQPEYPEFSDADLQRIGQELRAQLQKFGISDRISLRVGERFATKQWAGAYTPSKRLIQIATALSDDPGATLAHEVIHAMRDLGLFTEAEWRSLENTAWKYMREWAEASYPSDTVKVQREEAAAEYFAHNWRERNTGGLWKRAADRIVDFIGSLMHAINLIRGKTNEYLEADRVMQRIMSGSIGQRATDESNPSRRRDGGVRAQMPGAIGNAFANPETEDRWQEARKGIGDGPGVLANAKEWWDDLTAGLTRHWRALPNEPRFADLQQQFRKMEAAPEAARDNAVRFLRDLVGKMDPQEYDLFSRKVVLDDLAWESASDHELPFGFTPTTLRRERQRIDGLVAQSPKLIEAVRKRKAFNKDIADQMVEAGVLTREQIKNPAYFRHMVLDYARAEARLARDPSSKVRSPYWAKRMGSALDINANLLEAELDWLQKAQVDIATARTIDWLKNSSHNIRDRLRQDARDRNATELSQRIAADPSLGKQEAKFRQMMALGFQYVKDELGNMPPIPAHLQAAADAIARGNRSGETPYPLLAWILDNRHPGSMGAAMVLKYGGMRKAWLRDTLGDRYIDPDDIPALVKRLAPEGYGAWQPIEGRHLFTAKTISESALDMFVGKLADTTYPGIDKDELHRALTTIRPQLVVGGERYTMVLPEEIVATLNEFGDRRGEGMVGRVFGAVQAGWKRWVLINPRRFFKYNINNMSGDLDAIIAGNPGTLRQVRRAWRELRDAAKGNPSLRVQEAIERGVFTSGLSIQEIPDINRLSAFRHLTEDRGTVNKLTIGAVANVWRALQDSTQFRENLFRHAAYLDYIEKIEKGVPQRDIGYGASVPQMVDAVTDPRDKAALLARDLVGDYGSISASGSWLRKYLVPFWSWTEINTRRYWRLTSNAYTTSKARGIATGGLLGAGVAARTGASLALRMALVYGLIYLWNHLLWGDEEDELGEMQQRQLHLIVGRTDDGEVMTLRLQGALSDVLGEMGVPDAVRGLKRYADGQGTIGQAVKDTLKAPINRVVTGVSPFYSVPLEQALGLELWPDVFNGRTIHDRVRHALSTFSVENEYDLIANRPSRGYARSWEESVLYRRDPGEMAYDTAKGIAYDWLKNVKGQDGGGQTSPRSEALRDYRLGLRYGDASAADEALVRYADLGGTDKSLKQSIARQHPLGPIAKKDRRAFLDSLTEEQLDVMARAEEWYNEVYLGIDAKEEAEQ